MLGVNMNRGRKLGSARAFALTLALGISLVGCGEDEREPAESQPADTAQADDVRAAARAFMADAELPGISLSLLDQRGVTFTFAAGAADVDGEVPVTADTSFWLASVTKPITGLAILRAREDGALSLDTKVSDLLSRQHGFAIGAPNADAITLRHLVTHRSSILDSDAYACAYFVGDEAGTRRSLANELYGEPLCEEDSAADLGGFLKSYLSDGGIYYGPDNFAAEAPGTRVEYSNVGAALAGYSIELSTGTSLADYARTQFFEPLGLEHTSFHLADLPAEGIAAPRIRDPEGELRFLPQYSLSTWPDGGLRSSANDLGKLLATLLHGGELGGTRILAEESVNDAFTPLATFADDIEMGVFWVLSTTVLEDGSTRRIAAHDGGDPGAFSLVLLDRDSSVGVVVLANGDYADSASSEALLDDLVKKAHAYAELLGRRN